MINNYNTKSGELVEEDKLDAALEATKINDGMGRGVDSEQAIKDQYEDNVLDAGLVNEDTTEAMAAEGRESNREAVGEKLEANSNAPLPNGGGQRGGSDPNEEKTAEELESMGVQNLVDLTEEKFRKLLDNPVNYDKIDDINRHILELKKSAKVDSKIYIKLDELHQISKQKKSAKTFNINKGRNEGRAAAEAAAKQDAMMAAVQSEADIANARLDEIRRNTTASPGMAGVVPYVAPLRGRYKVCR